MSVPLDYNGYTTKIILRGIKNEKNNRIDFDYDFGVFSNSM